MPPTTHQHHQRSTKDRMDALMGQLAQANENTWMLIGAVSEQLKDQDKAAVAFDHALRHNPHSIMALTAAAGIARARDHFDKAIEYFQRALNIKQDNGEVWGSLGHCYLMKDDLQKAYTAYQQALYYLPNPKDARLWYGIGILYDRYGSFEHAEEAFSSVLKMEPNFDKANEIYFRLGIIYKQQHKHTASLDCFKYILNNPPAPLTSWDIWFQIGHVHELEQDFTAAKDAYMRVLNEQPNHAKVLQQLGWLYHQTNAPFANQDQAVAYLTKSLETDGADAQSWYFLGRAFMAGQKYNKAYEAYQQAVYRDGRNPTFWCSIGVLYYQINQYRDALDAYSRAIRLNPYISEVWYNLGTLYESCNNQVNDAIDAYIRALELDPSNAHIKTRLGLLKNVQAHGGQAPPAPTPQDVHPTAYSTNTGPPNQFDGNSHGSSHGQAPPPGPGYGPPGHLADPQHSARDLPAPPPLGDFPRGESPAAFRGVNPPPLHDVDESRGSMSRHAPLAPMDIDRAASSGPAAHKAEQNPREYSARDTRDARETREGPYNSHPRYEPSSDARRRMDSPHGSPRRRGEGAGYQSYGYHSSASGSGYPAPSRERDMEFEKRAARERDARDRDRSASRSTAQPPYVDPRHPSPRMNERRPQGIEQARRESPSPDLARRAPYPPPYSSHPPERRPEERRPEERRPEERRTRPETEKEEPRRQDAPPNGNGSAFRRPSISHDVEAAATPRQSSPAVSSTAKEKGAESRKRKNKEAPAEKADKKEKKEKPVGKDKKGDKRATGSSLKITLQRAKTSGSKEDEETATGSSHETSPERTLPAVSRVIDDDYDEGAADALMFLHGDRSAESGGGTTGQPPVSPAALERPSTPLPSLKRSQPASPGTDEPEDGQAKRLKVDDVPPSEAPNGQEEASEAPAAADEKAAQPSTPAVATPAVSTNADAIESLPEKKQDGEETAAEPNGDVTMGEPGGSE